jgi:methionyl-tRNA synthetase
VDRTIRTTDPRHHRTVQWLFERCVENGYIYKGSYTGQYCTFDELYVSEAKPGDPCPDCGRPTETVTEENYFFKLSAFTRTACSSSTKRSPLGSSRRYAATK